MKSNLKTYIIICFFFVYQFIYSQRPDSTSLINIDPSVKSTFSEFLILFFTVMIGAGILGMAIMLFNVIYFEGRRHKDTNLRILSFFIGLLSIVSLDVITNLKINDIIISYLTKQGPNELSANIPKFIIAFLSIIVGAFISYQFNKKIKDEIIERRIFVLLSTIVLFYLVRLYVIAIETAMYEPMIVNLSFIIGYSLILILSNKSKKKIESK